MSDHSAFEFQKSSFSGSQGACIEVARNVPGIVALRDSKDPSGPVLTVSDQAWSAFLADIKRGTLPLPSPAR